MVEFVKETEIPEIERNFKPTEETLELTAIFYGLEPGDIIRLPVNSNLSPQEHKREMARLRGSALSAAKRAEGRFNITIRKGDIYVQRLD